jgi:GMP synthase-like glutamine amidotransferase
VLILQHLNADGPAYLATWLRQRGLPFVVRNSEAGEAYPERLAGFSALAVLGGEMSANDPLPSLRRAEALIRQAVQQGVPTLGHCLGGQLMARALGGSVGASPAPEVGWQPMRILGAAAAPDWFGGRSSAQVFQWHFEAVEPPPGAVTLATSAACVHQVFALGPHLAMQFHLEIDLPKLERWAAADDPRHAAALREHAGSVQSAAQMREGAAWHLAAHQRLADAVYARWIRMASG